MATPTFSLEDRPGGRAVLPFQGGSGQGSGAGGRGSGGVSVGGGGGSGGRAPQASLGRLGYLASNAGQEIDENTYAAITKLGQDIITPHIKAETQKQYMAGVQRAMEGEAIKDIVESQPWYSQIFGPTSAVMGARAYTAQAKIAELGAQLEREMPQLAQQPASALTERLSALQQELMTGDAVVDGILTTQIVEQMAPAYKRHAKEHYIYQQNRAVEAQGQAWAAAANSFQERSKGFLDGTVTPEDYEADKQRLRAALTPFADQSVDSYHANVMRFIENAAVQGNFHAIKMLRDDGVLDQLPIDNRSQLERALAVAGNRALNKALLEDERLALEYRMVVDDTAQNPAKLRERLVALNEKAAAITGVTEVPLIDGNEVAQITGNILRAQAAGRDQQSRDEADVARALAALGAGRAELDTAVGVTTHRAVEQAGLMLWTREGDPVRRAELLQANEGVVITAARDFFDKALASQEDNHNVQHVAAIWSALSTDRAKAAYVPSEEQRAFLDQYVASLAAGAQPAEAFVQAKHIRPMRAASKDAAGIQGAVRSTIEAHFDSWKPWKPDRLQDYALGVFSSMAASSARRAGGPAPDDVKASRAVSQLLDSQALDIMGSHAIIGGERKRSLYHVFTHGSRNMSSKEAADAFDGYLAKRSEELGAELGPGSYIVRLPDYTDDGEVKAQFMVEFSYAGEDGFTRIRSARFTSDDVKKFYVSSQKQQAEDRRVRDESIRTPIADPAEGTRRQAERDADRERWQAMGLK
jgi:hypothetical protein